MIEKYVSPAKCKNFLVLIFEQTDCVKKHPNGPTKFPWSNLSLIYFL